MAGNAMTPIQQTQLSKLKAIASANLAFFEKNMPMHRLMLMENPTASIDISDQGDLTVRYENGETKSVVADMFEMEGKLIKFRDLDDRPQLLAFHKLRSVVANPSHGVMQRYHYSNLDAEFPNRARRHFLQHFPDNSGLTRYPEFGDNEIPLLIVFGTGMGWHLNRLLLEYRIRHLIIIETDIDRFRLSNFFVDYTHISRVAMEQGTDLSLIVDTNIDNVSRSLMTAMLRNRGLPIFCIHGAALFYAVDESEELARIRGAIMETMWEMFFGMGYFDDELISVKHTLANLKKGFPVYAKPNTMPEDAVAFIVGSGPSLDGLIPILQQYRDRAVVFSCGTSLSGLFHAGIKPDFHLEKERPYLQYEVITKTVDREFLKGVGFLGLNVVHPDVYGLFDSHGVIMKAADVMTNLLAKNGLPKEIILNTQPTVTNTAIDYCLSAGFKRIYLFGVDMGYKETEKHHSGYTFYLDRVPEEDHLKALLSKPPASQYEVEGNFGGVVTTTKIFAMSRRQMGQAIVRHPASQVYNLNDGAKIDGAIPLPPEEFKWLSEATSKASAIEAIHNTLVPMAFDEALLKQQLIEEHDAFVDAIRAIIEKPRERRSHIIDALSEIYQFVLTESNLAQPCGLMYRGIVNNLLSYTFNAITIIKDEDEALAKAEWDFANLLEFFEQARQEILKVYDQTE